MRDILSLLNSAWKQPQATCKQMDVAVFQQKLIYKKGQPAKGPEFAHPLVEGYEVVGRTNDFF